MEKSRGMIHDSNSARKSLWRKVPGVVPTRCRGTLRSRGVSMLELALAAVIFAVVAGMLITGLGQAFGARIATSATGQVHEWLENAADELANGDFTELLEGEFTAPEPCDGDTQTSCFEVLGRQFTATWDVEIGRASCRERV